MVDINAETGSEIIQTRFTVKYNVLKFNLNP
jgi:hypothetical protein